MSIQASKAAEAGFENRREKAGTHSRPGKDYSIARQVYRVHINVVYAPPRVFASDRPSIRKDRYDRCWADHVDPHEYTTDLAIHQRYFQPQSFLVRLSGSQGVLNKLEF